MTAQDKIEAVGNGNVHQRLNRARQLFHTGQIKKSGKNTFAKYEYFELGDFIIPALRIFDQVGLGATPISIVDGMATMQVVNLDEPTDLIALAVPAGSANLKGCHEVQNIGAVQTYQRRYLWMAALEIVEHDAIEQQTGAEAQQGAVSPPSYKWPEGPASGISKMKDMVRPLWREVMGCGDDNELTTLLEVPEHKALIQQMINLENPAHRELWEGDGKDNPGLSGVIEKARQQFKQKESVNA